MDRKAQQRLEQLGDFQQSLGFLDDPNGKSPAELAMMFPRSKFTELDDDAYFSMLDSLEGTEPEVNTETDRAFGMIPSSDKVDDTTTEAMPSNTLTEINMDNSESMDLLTRIDESNTYA
mgnify:CR=1 FL=1|tara:strand:+ start:1702 stop:2058 length:357 start_codon:yes stop_codon:yes gene_type:complete